MKEVTVVTLVELTDIFTIPDESRITSDEVCGQVLKTLTYADDVKIKKRQVFIRDLPNN